LVTINPQQECGSMAANHTSGAGVLRNPGNPIVDLEAVNISVRPDVGLNAVELTVTDATGRRLPDAL
jgi:hypothetical protein